MPNSSQSLLLIPQLYLRIVGDGQATLVRADAFATLQELRAEC